jgi:hypothetical protein
MKHRLAHAAGGRADVAATGALARLGIEAARFPVAWLSLRG